MILSLIGRDFLRPIAEISGQFRASEGRLDDVDLKSTGLSTEVGGLVHAFNGMRNRARIEAQKARQAQEMLETAVEITGLGYCLFSLDEQRAFDVEGRFLDLHGAAPDQGDKTLERIFGQVLEKCQNSFDAVSNTGEPETISDVVEWRQDDGKTRHLSRTYHIRRDAEDKGILVDVAAMDISDLNNLEEQLRQSQKMEMVGNLTGGIAHDFNNLLAVIMGNLELLRDELTDSAQKELLDNGLEATLRGADLTRSMLAFARKATLQPTVLDLNEVVRTSKNWVGRTISENIDIETSLLAGLWKVEADLGSTANALLNLFVNARDAMPHGGQITVETSNMRIDENYIDERGEDVEPGRYVLIAVSDTGTGMTARTLDQIFEPFFTTKPVGAGSGLGLPMVLGFMKQSGGTVRVYSEPGVGTTFKLFFPALFDERAVASRTLKEQITSVTAGARILVVEDEARLLEYMGTVLTRAGYNIQTASSGDEAAEIFRKDSSFDVVLTDIVMPGNLQGTNLARVMREIRPDLPVVFMTGYASEAAVHGNGLRPEDIRLMKPVRRVDLLAAIEKSISGHSATPNLRQE